MPTVTKTWTLASSAEGWTGMTWNSGGYLYASGTLNPPTGEQITADFVAKSPTSTTWLSLGVPNNAIAVTHVAAGCWRKRVTCSNVNLWAGDFTIGDASNNNIIGTPYLGSISMPLGTDSVFVNAGGGGADVLSAYQDPSTVIRLYFDFSVESHVGPTITTYAAGFNTFSLTMTYTVPYNFPALTLAP